MEFINITYILGNGFDLRNQLPTKYVDFFSYLNDSHSEELEKNFIFKGIKKDIEVWSNFENQLGVEILKQLRELEMSNLEEKEKLDVREKLADDFFNILIIMAEYISSINENYTSQDVQFSLGRSISLDLFKNILQSTTGNYSSLKKEISKLSNHSAIVSLVFLNYTTYFGDYFLNDTYLDSILSKGGVYYPHGNVRDSTCLVGTELDRIDDLEFSKIFEKRNHAIEYLEGLTDLDTNINEVFNNTEIFVIYGFSFGKSDTDFINDLFKNTSNKLYIIYLYPKEGTRRYEYKEKERIKNMLIEDFAVSQDIVDSNIYFVTNDSIIFGK